ncbi:hypothetical protein HDV04_005760 [Boothiomyces sp. JEL0838]|nr:hypothetical protein HDV04_005760 [Boothiomyces sp. JEL0838]
MSIVFQSLWNAYECNGIPVSFLVFNENYAPDYYFYSFASYCGQEGFPSDNGVGCCTSSVDIQQTDLRYSWQNTYIGGEWDYQTSAYQSANLHTYCHIDFYNSTNLIIPTLFQNIQSAYYLNDGECHYGFKCSDGAVYVYQEMECQNILEEIPFSNKPNITTISLGTITVSLVEFHSASNYIQWITYQPAMLFYPSNSATVVLLGLISYILSTLIALSFIWFHSRKIQEKKSISAILIQLFFLVEVFGYAYDTYGPVPTRAILFVITVLNHVGIFSKLLCNLISADILSHLLNFQSSLTLCCLYGLLSSFYFMHLIVFVMKKVDNLFIQFTDLNRLKMVSESVNNFYYGFSCLFDLIPIIIMLYRILLQYGIKEKKKGFETKGFDLICKYKTPIFIIVIEIIGTVGYAILYYLYALTNVLYSDQNKLGIQGVFALLDQLQITGTLLLYSYLRYFTEELVRTPTNKKLIPTTEKSIQEPPTVKMTDFTG